ncbi:MAG: undecaprenyldiphospho-muramoylpentapeptide beta-N-acetylglucosaminyltransferase [Bacteroidota bacterium]|nr:undecaprenyldiphospho-muramoylpentapeptide beta-N-acetylglucosaminyltransferase [Bacteroidota bacterium]
MPVKIILSAGGTGGHIFPALAVANSLREHYAKSNETIEILFVGANGRMEMEKVPQAGYPIKGLDVAGIQRGFSVQSLLKNLSWPLKLIKSIYQAYSIVNEFKPNLVAGFGGYASGPILFIAQLKGIPTLIQEQNSYAGITNKLLSKKVRKVCVAYDGMEKYFPKNKIEVTGNPVRSEFNDADLMKLPAMMHFKLSPEIKTLLVIGGSLGARSINLAIEKNIDKIKESGIQLIWQTGKNYTPDPQLVKYSKFVVQPFIKEMHWAYAAANLVISRAGALSISEMCVIGKPAIFVPLPSAAEDHQTKNANYLVQHNAALMIADKNATNELVETALQLINNEASCQTLKNNIKLLGKPNAATDIKNQIIQLLN